MRILLILAGAAALLLAGCASSPQQSANNANVSTNQSCPGSGAPITTHQIGNGAGDPTANTGACPTPTANATVTQ